MVSSLNNAFQRIVEEQFTTEPQLEVAESRSTDRREAAPPLTTPGYVPSVETLGSVRPMRCNDPRKQALAWLIKRNTMAEDEWVTRELDMGHRSNVSRAVSAFRSESSRTIRRLKRKLHICTD